MAVMSWCLSIVKHYQEATHLSQITQDFQAGLGDGGLQNILGDDADGHLRSWHDRFLILAILSEQILREEDVILLHLFTQKGTFSMSGSGGESSAGWVLYHGLDFPRSMFAVLLHWFQEGLPDCQVFIVVGNFNAKICLHIQLQGTETQVNDVFLQRRAKMETQHSEWLTFVLQSLTSPLKDISVVMNGSVRLPTPPSILMMILFTARMSYHIER